MKTACMKVYSLTSYPAARKRVGKTCKIWMWYVCPLSVLTCHTLQASLHLFSKNIIAELKGEATNCDVNLRHLDCAIASSTYVMQKVVLAKIGSYGSLWVAKSGPPEPLMTAESGPEIRNTQASPSTGYHKDGPLVACHKWSTHTAFGPRLIFCDM